MLGVEVSAERNALNSFVLLRESNVTVGMQRGNVLREQCHWNGACIVVIES